MNGSYQNVLHECSLELENIKRWEEAHRLDSNIRYLTSYAIIKASGTIEYVLKQMLYDALSVNANEEAKNYLMKNIVDASFNPSPGMISKMLEKMSQDWKDEFENKIKGTNQKGQLKSLVDLRNSFAHGTTITASMSDVVSYYESGIFVLEALYDIIISD